MPAMFSKRTHWDLRPNRLTQALDERRATGLPVLDLTESNPTAVGLLPPPDLLQSLAGEGGRVYEPDPRGLRAAREAVARDFRRRGVALEADRLLLTASSSEAYGYLFKLLCDPGERVLVARPSYPLFDYLAALESVHVDRCELRWDGQWHLDFGSLEHALTPQTRAVIVVHPNNPTGSYLARAEAERLHELCGRHGLALIADEVFADYALGPPPSCPSLAQDGPALVFTLGGLSKSCGLPQLKLGWIAVTGPEALRRQALERLEIVADSYLSVATPVQRAAPALLSRLPALQAPIQARVTENLARLVGALPRDSPASLLRPEGGWYAVLRVPATLPEDERVLRLLECHGVLVHPGFFFDFAQEAYLVLSLLPEPGRFAEGLFHVLADVSAR